MMTFMRFLWSLRLTESSRRIDNCIRGNKAFRKISLFNHTIAEW